MGRVSEYFLELSEFNIGSVPDKKVCIRHFEDKHINRFIIKNYEKGFCNYCNKDLKVCNLEDVLKFMMKGIQNFYEDAANYQPFESKEGGYLYGTLTVNDLIQSEIGLVTEPFELTEDIINSIDDLSWSNYYDIYDSPTDDLARRWEFFKQTVKHQTRYFFKFRNSKIDYFQDSINAEETLSDLGGFIKKYNLLETLPSETPVFRARQHKISDIDKLQRQEELVSPPLNLAKYPNRFSPSGVPMFYGGFDRQTIISEIYNPKNKSNKRITIGEFKTKRKIRVLDFTKIPSIPSIFQPEKYKNYFDILFLHQLVKDLSEPITIDKLDHIEYVPTQIITEFLRYPFNDTLKKKIEGIIYPSAKSNGKTCVVFFWNQTESISKLTLVNKETLKTSKFQ
jgi:hypothetical protein